VARTYSTAVVLVLLAATTVAFVVTERLKLEPSPVTKVSATKVFSPTCECDTDFAVIHFTLRKANRMTLAIVDANRARIRTLLGPVARKRGPVETTWDGRDEDGAVVPDGAYRTRVDLGYRTIYMPNRIRVDATPPVVKLRHVGPRILEPGSRLKVRYLLNEPARVSVYLDGRRVLLGRSSRLKWKVEWQARARPGKHRVTVTARDTAGNLSDATRPVVVVFPLRVLTTHVSVRPRERFAVRILDDQRAYFWRLGGNGGFASSSVLRLRAPKRAGHYRLVIRQDRVAHVVPVVVMPRR
jgi:flagellar hook capping protein FlgD